MVTLERRIERLESDVHNLKHSNEELRVDIQESEDRQMAALADLKSEMTDRLDRLEALIKLTLRGLYLSLLTSDKSFADAIEKAAKDLPGGGDIIP